MINTQLITAVGGGKARNLGLRITFVTCLGLFFLSSWPVGGEPLTLRHIADVSVPVKVAVQWLDCTPQHCVYPGPHEFWWSPYRFVGGFVDAGIDVNWVENGGMVVMLAVRGAATMRPLDTAALARLDSASEGDVPSTATGSLWIENSLNWRDAVGTADTALALNIDASSLGDFGRPVALGISAEGRLLVALDEYIEYGSRGWEFGAGRFAGTGNPETLTAECRAAQAELGELNDLVCSGDAYPVPPAQLPPLENPPPPVEFSLWQVHLEIQ